MQADVTVVAVMTGFVATRVALVQPVLFTFEESEDLNADTIKNQKLVAESPNKIMARWTKLLKRKFDPSCIGGLRAAQGPGGDVHRFSEDSEKDKWLTKDQIIKGMKSGRATKRTFDIAITGRQGGSTQGLSGSDIQHLSGTYIDRNREISDSEVRSQVAQIVTALQYQNEYGAYYGVVDDPVTHEGGFCVSSVRRIIPYLGEFDVPRWNRDVAYHGLIGGEGGKNMKAQWGSFENEGRISSWNGRSGVVGYTHGMMWAIQHAKQIGPWATPYEIAVGALTRKLASCFACTTFMYATGYPPSGIHMGSADSWVPLPPRGTENPHATELTKTLNDLWANDVAGYLVLGAEILANGPVSDGARPHVNGLRQAAIQRKKFGAQFAAAMYLDALTMHKNDRARLHDVLAP